MSEHGVDPTDTAARARALEPDRSFIVQAPAGSGKTELLIQRYLALLARVEKPEEVLAITFTRKAAAEMRSRILAALQGARKEEPPVEAHLRRTWELACAALARVKELDWELHENPARMRIQTIDALCVALIRQMPVLSGFGADVSVTSDADELYRRAAQRVLSSLDDDEQLAPSLERLLQHLDNDMSVVEELLASMLATRDQWLRHVVDAEHPLIQRPALQGTLEDAVSAALASLCSATPKSLQNEIALLAAYAGDNLWRERVDSPIQACKHMRELPGATMDDLEEWRGIKELLLTGQGKPRSQVTAAQGFLAPSATSDTTERERRAGYKQRMEEVLGQLGDAGTFVARLAEVPLLPRAEYSHVQWTVFQSLLSLLPRAVADLKLMFEHLGAVDFTEIAHAALRALGDPGNPTDLALSLDYRLQHILIDEFQDTSYTQYALLERLTAGWTVADGRTLFLVGDPMQSIYRFREAEVGLFLRMQHEGMGDIQPEVLRLSRNFRSRAPIVDWINATFTRAFPDEEDLAAGAVRYAPVEPAYEEDDGAPAVTVHAGIDRDSCREARQVLALVEEARDKIGGSTAILVRNRHHLGQILPVLRAAGVRYRAVEIDPLAGQPVVQDLYSLTRALLHLGDRVSWLAILRAPWCGLALADLHALVGDRPGQTVWELVIEEDRRRGLSEDGQKRLSRFKRVLADSLGQRGRRRLRRWVEGTWTALGGPVCVVNAAELRNARRYLALLERLDKGGELERLEDLDYALGRLFAEPEPGADDTLQVMTIHRAKGLEFDTVVVPALDRLPRRQPDRLLMLLERPSLFGGSHLLVAPIRASDELDPVYAYLKHLDGKCDRNEQTRLLYVAATRARRRLHLLGATSSSASGDVQAPPRNSLLARLWPAVEAEFRRERATPRVEDVAREPPRSDAEDGAGRQRIRRLSSEWLLPEAPLPRAWRVPQVIAEERVGLEREWASDVARQVGTVVHRALGQIGREGAAQWCNRWLDGIERRFGRMLSTLGVPAARLEEAADRAGRAVRQTLEDERGRWILDETHEAAESEFALSGWLDGGLVHVVLDRTFIDADGVRWVVDYKTGTHEGGSLDAFIEAEVSRHADQLERYATLLRRMASNPVKVGIYFPLMQVWREWQPQ